MALQNALGALALDATSQAVRDRLPAALNGDGGFLTHVTNTIDIADRSGRIVGHVTVDNSSLAVTGPLTDTQLRATAVPVSGTFYPATQPVSLATAPTTPVTGTFWQATQPVSGPVTDTQLRASAVPVSLASAPTTPVTGTFWQATQPVSAAALPLPAGASTETTLAAVNTKLAGTLTVDTELPAAAALADGAANPTTPLSGSPALIFNGTNWDRERGNWDTTTGDTGTKAATFAGATQTNYNARGAIVTVKLGTVSGTSPTLSCQLQWSYDGGTTWVNIGTAIANLTATGNTGVYIIYPANSSVAGATPAALTTGATQTTYLNLSLPRLWRINYTIAGTSPSFALTATYVNYSL